MEITRTVAALRQAVGDARRSGARIGLVPTMGFLHDGHLSLIKACRARSDFTIVSIFVNPTQFGPTEDLTSYPRDLARDAALCRDAGAALIFAPEPGEVYPPAFQTWIEPGELAKPLCGGFRPGHFRGVATVVAKLFNMAAPDVAVFGQKDFQQCAVVRRMAEDLEFPVEIVVAPTVRDPDGLAMSSRNAYLTFDERSRALCLSRGLCAAQTAFLAGERDAERLRGLARQKMSDFDTLQYLELVDAGTLQTISGSVNSPVALCVAAIVGGTRLIDNVMMAP